MKKIEVRSITRIISDLIKADSIIDIGYMDVYSCMKGKYGIQRNGERAVLQMPLSAELSVMSKTGARFRKEFCTNCCDYFNKF